MRIAVIGVGHLGKIHARIYKELPNVELVAVVDSREAEAKTVAEKLTTQAMSDYHDLLGKVDAVSIATPTVSHFAIAWDFLQAGAHVLLEKPMTPSVREAAALVELAAQKNLKIQVGHSERCNPIVVALNQRKLTPLFIDAQRWSPYRFRSGDIGAVLDLMIHDIDLVQAWIPSPLLSVEAIGMPVIGPLEDIAYAYLTYQGGSASLMASRIARTPNRKLRLFTKDAYVEIDCGSSQGKVYKIRPEFDLMAMNLQKGVPPAFAGINFEEMFYDKMVQAEDLVIVKEEPLKKELAGFVDCIVHNTEPIVSGAVAFRTIQTAELILQKIKANLANVR